MWGEKDSIWWRDIDSLGSTHPDFDDIFRDGLNCVNGNEEEVLFCKSWWNRRHHFKMSSQIKLFRVTVHQNITAAEVFWSSWWWTGRWYLEWSRELSEARKGIWTLFWGNYIQVSSQKGGSGVWISKLFPVRSIYQALMKDHHKLKLEPELRRILGLIWMVPIPLKVYIFGWRLLLVRLLTRGALLHRGW